MREGFFTKTEEARKSGSLRKAKPRSTLCCSVYVWTNSWSERWAGSSTLVATRKEALRRAWCVTASASTLRVAWTCHSRRVGGSVVAGPSGSLMLGQGVYLSVHDQPVPTGLELSSQCCPRIRLASKPLVAQMPERFLPLLTCRVDLPRQCRACALLTLCRAHYQPAFARRWLRHGRPPQGSRRVLWDLWLLLPGVVGHLQRRAPPSKYRAHD